jgi:hypothetical protein
MEKRSSNRVISPKTSMSPLRIAERPERKKLATKHASSSSTAINMTEIENMIAKIQLFNGHPTSLSLDKDGKPINDCL